MLELILASGNSHKAEELSELFLGKITVSSSSLKIEVLEDGSSFHENAYKKAKAYYDKLKVPVISDDSGLIVEALPNELGIHTARFGGDDLSYNERCKLLLKRLEHENNRSAYFSCQLCVYLSESEIYFFEGRVNGTLGHEIRGSHGFGYDPVFIPNGVDGHSTLAELPEWKMKNSHRARASQSALKFLLSMPSKNVIN